LIQAKLSNIGLDFLHVTEAGDEPFDTLASPKSYLVRSVELLSLILRDSRGHRENWPALRLAALAAALTAEAGVSVKCKDQPAFDALPKNLVAAFSVSAWISAPEMIGFRRPQPHVFGSTLSEASSDDQEWQPHIL
jgi:hypothetical protein